MNNEKYFNDIAAGVESSVKHYDESKIFNPNVKQEILRNSLISPPVLQIDKTDAEVEEKSIKTANAVAGLKSFEDKYDSVTFTVPVTGDYTLLVKLLEEAFTPRKDVYMSGTNLKFVHDELGGERIKDNETKTAQVKQIAKFKIDGLNIRVKAFAIEAEKFNQRLSANVDIWIKQRQKDIEDNRKLKAALKPF